MALKFFGNVNKAEADLEATDKLVQSDCEKSGVKSAMRDGKVIPLAEATTSEKYAALRAAQPSGEDLESRAQLVQRNGIIAADLEATTNKLTAAQATIASLTHENGQIKSKNETLETSNVALSGEKSTQINLRDAAVKENARLDKELVALNTAVSKHCLKHNALDLKGGDGKSLTGDAAIEAANKIPVEERLAADDGALNKAAASLGVNISTLPGQPGQTSTSKPTMARETFLALSPNEQTEFFKSGGKLKD